MVVFFRQIASILFKQIFYKYLPILFHTYYLTHLYFFGNKLAVIDESNKNLILETFSNQFKTFLISKCKTGLLSKLQFLFSNKNELLDWFAETPDQNLSSILYEFFAVKKLNDWSQAITYHTGPLITKSKCLE
jgi:hypothetical protein